MEVHECRKWVGTCLMGLLCLSFAASAMAEEGKCPITTSSTEARELYLEGRTLTENLRFTDARQYFLDAVAKDENFALAHLALANTAATNQGFWDELRRAVALADQVSEGERRQILGFDAGAKGEPATQKEHYTKLVELFPDDERAHELLANHYFGQLEYESAVKQYKVATGINPDYAPPYNNLGYAYRALEEYADAETAFQKYIALIPEEPNPYDSYAELLMKMGRFEESIQNYEKALALDPNFVASHVGIGNNYVFLGQPLEAKKTFRQLYKAARTVAEQRQALFWMAVASLHEDEHEAALNEVEKEYGLAEKDQDLGAMSGDLVFMGDILVDAGDTDQALAKYSEAVEVMDRADVPDEVKETTRRDYLYRQARVALKKGDLETAKSKADTYRKQVEVKGNPFEHRQNQELAGMIALEEADYAAALSALGQANQQNPRVLYLTALALQGQGEGEQAKAVCEKAANFNGLNVNYAYVRSEAQQMLAEAMSVK